MTADGRKNCTVGVVALKSMTGRIGAA